MALDERIEREPKGEGSRESGAWYAAVALLALMVGSNYLPTTRRNGLIGIRLPWTLRSDEVWRRTHALGGRLFVALGIATLGSALVSSALGNAVLLGGLLLLLLALAGYSYRLSRKLKLGGSAG